MGLDAEVKGIGIISSSEPHQLSKREKEVMRLDAEVKEIGVVSSSEPHQRSKREERS